MDIYEAIKQNDIQSVKTIINRDTCVIHHRNHYRETPLLFACSYGHTEIVQLLIKAGSDVGEKDKDGWTPLHVACYYGRQEVVQLLIHHGVDWFVVNNERHTPLDLAISEQSGAVLLFLETIINQFPGSERKKIQACRFRHELTKTS